MIRTQPFLRILLALLLCAVSPLLSAAEAKGTVLITGANRGIGLALAAEFAEAGYSVIGTARSPDRAAELKALGVQVEQLDVTSQESADALAARLDGLALDILVNNAGIKGQDEREMAKIDIDRFRQVLEVNTLGPLRVTQALFSNLQSGSGVVANVSSMMGSNELNTWGCCMGYRASKAAVNSMTTTMALDYGKTGLVFVTLHPGYVQTDMNDGQGNITPTQSAEGLFTVITGLQPGDNGGYFNWKGEALPW